MKDRKQPVCECFSEADRMINEGLGSGTINPKYTEVHAKLKEKQELLLLSDPLDESIEKMGDNKSRLDNRLHFS